MTTQVNTFTDIEAKDYATTGKNATINCVVLSDGELSTSTGWTAGTYTYKKINSDSRGFYIRAGTIQVQIKNWSTDLTYQEYFKVPSAYKYQAHTFQYVNTGGTLNYRIGIYPYYEGYVGKPILDCEKLQIILPNKSIITVTSDMWKIVQIAQPNTSFTSYWYAVELNQAELYLGLNNDGGLYIFTTESAGQPKYQYEDLQLKVVIGELSTQDRHIDEYLYDVYIFTLDSNTISNNGFNYISFFSLTSSETVPTSDSKLLASRQLGYYIPFITGQNGKIDKIFIRVKSDRWDESKITIDVIFDPDYQKHLELVAGTVTENPNIGFNKNHSVTSSTLPQLAATDSSITIVHNVLAKNIFQHVGESRNRLQMASNDSLNYSYYLWYYWKPNEIATQLTAWYSNFGTWRSSNEKITINDNDLPGPYIGFNDEFGSFLYSYWYSSSEQQLILILAGSNQYHHVDIYCVDMSSSGESPAQLEKINNESQPVYTINHLPYYRMKVNRWFNDIYFVWNNKLYEININPGEVLKTTKTFDPLDTFINSLENNPMNDSSVTWASVFPDHHYQLRPGGSYSDIYNDFWYNSNKPLWQWDTSHTLTANSKFEFNSSITINRVLLTDISNQYLHYIILNSLTSVSYSPVRHRYQACLIAITSTDVAPSLVANSWFPAVYVWSDNQLIGLDYLTTYNDNMYIIPNNILKALGNTTFNYNIRCLTTRSQIDSISNTKWAYDPMSDSSITWYTVFNNKIVSVLQPYMWQTTENYFQNIFINQNMPYLYQWDLTNTLTATTQFEFNSTANHTYIGYEQKYLHIYTLQTLTSSSSYPAYHYKSCLVAWSDSPTTPAKLAGTWMVAVWGYVRRGDASQGDYNTPLNFISYSSTQYIIGSRISTPITNYYPDKNSPEIFSNSDNQSSIYNPEFSDLGDVIITSEKDANDKKHYYLQPLIADQDLINSTSLPSNVEIKLDTKNTYSTHISSCFNKYTIDNPEEQTPLIAMYVLSVQHIRWLEEHGYEVYYIGASYTVGVKNIQINQEDTLQYIFLNKCIPGHQKNNDHWERLKINIPEDSLTKIISFADDSVVIHDYSSNSYRYYRILDLFNSNATGNESPIDAYITKDRYVTIKFDTDADNPLPRRVFGSPANGGT